MIRAAPDLNVPAYPEKVQHGDVTVGVKRADKYSFYHFRGILLPLLFEVCTGAGPVDALEVQSSNSNTKASRVQEGFFLEM